MSARLLTVASSLLVGLGVVMLGFYGVSQVNASRGHQEGLAAFEAAREAERIRIASADPAPATSVTDSGLPEETRFAASSMPATDETRQLPALAVSKPDKSLWSEKRIADYEKYDGADEVPEGILRIPSVDLELPVFAGTEEVNLTRGAGIIEGTAPLGTPGNTGIAAHRDGYFRALKDVSVGDTLVVETLSGQHDYRIDELLIVYPEDIHVLDPIDDNVITLVTCYPFYYAGSAPQRFIVRATRR